MVLMICKWAIATDKWSKVCGGAFSQYTMEHQKKKCHAEMWSAAATMGWWEDFNDKSKTVWEQNRK